MVTRVNQDLLDHRDHPELQDSKVHVVPKDLWDPWDQQVHLAQEVQPDHRDQEVSKESLDQEDLQAHKVQQESQEPKAHREVPVREALQVLVVPVVKVETRAAQGHQDLKAQEAPLARGDPQESQETPVIQDPMVQEADQVPLALLGPQENKDRRDRWVSQDLKGGLATEDLLVDQVQVEDQDLRVLLDQMVDQDHLDLQDPQVKLEPLAMLVEWDVQGLRDTQEPEGWMAPRVQLAPGDLSVCLEWLGLAVTSDPLGLQDQSGHKDLVGQWVPLVDQELLGQLGPLGPVEGLGQLDIADPEATLDELVLRAHLAHLGL